MENGGAELFGGARLAALVGASIVLILLGGVVFAILASRRLERSSLFNRLFIVVAVTSGFFSGIT